VADQVRTFCKALERESRRADWQIRQADIYFVHFLKRTDWQKRPASTVVEERGHTSRPAVLEQLRHRLRARYYSYRTECTSTGSGASSITSPSARTVTQPRTCVVRSVAFGVRWPHPRRVRRSRLCPDWIVVENSSDDDAKRACRLWRELASPLQET
jgi:hypothetical protein